MNKREYFRTNEPCAALCISAFAYYVFYGIEYGINDYAYITYETDDGVQAQHRLLMRHTKSGEPYVLLDGRRLKMSEFDRLG